MKHPQTPASALQNAFQSINATYAEAFVAEGVVPSEQRGHALSIVANPFWRPICELEVNGATDYIGGLALLALGYASPRTFTVRSGPYIGTVVEALEFTPDGEHYFDDISKIHRQRDTDWEMRCNLIDRVANYAAVDFGVGIVARRSALEIALETDDFDYLNRVRRITNETYQFNHRETFKAVDAGDRARLLHTVSEWETSRPRAEIIDASVRVAH